jgi:prolyl-tRNA editing enzyme YbaK/EbsC (Cys-tRNA(Pro) deacylase)
MSIENVTNHLAKFNRHNDIMEFPVSSATVELAAEALNVIPARIAKTIALKKDDTCVLICVAGDAKIDNKKFKTEFEIKAKMLTPEETLTLTGHAVGGVCPFGVPENLLSYTDISLQRFNTVFPACGSSNSAIELTCDDLFKLANSQKWVDVCKGWNEE